LLHIINNSRLFVYGGLTLIRSTPGCPRQGPCTDDLKD